MTGLRTLDDLEVAGRTVLVRLDLNVPMQDGEVTDASRIERSVPTVRELVEKNAKVVVLAHFGRPKGKRESSMSLRPLCGPLGKALGGIPVAFAEDCIGEPAKRAVAALEPGGVLLLENLRFHPGEEKNDPAFADQLASLGELFVDDAFSAAHRAHASITGLAERLPAAAGRLMQAEVEALSRALENPERPLIALVGGAKISTKLELLGNLIAKVDILVLGGGMANTFLHAQGTAVGRSLCEQDMAETARQIMADAAARKCQMVLPVDGRIASEFKAGAELKLVPIDQVPADAMILDIGPASVRADRGVDRSLQDAGLERPARRLRDPAVRCRHDRRRETRRRAHRRGPADERRRRRRYARSARPCRRARAVLLCFDRRRRLPGMARGQGAARRRGAAPTLTPPQVVIHDLEQARAVLEVARELGVAIELRSAPGAAAYAGVGYLKALGDLAGQELRIDCGEDAGLVMAALRTGCRKLAFSGPADIALRLADMAAQLGAEFRHERAPPACLDLAPDADAGRAAREWLKAPGALPGPNSGAS